MIARKLARDRSGSTAAEFGLVLPLLLLLLFGIIDAGRWMWTYNQAEKATQMGARFAIVTDYVSSSVGSSYLGSCSPALTQGDLIPASCFTKITCISTGCDNGTKNDAAFTAIYNRMKFFLPTLQPTNLTIEYNPSGLGYAGSPILPDLSPLVTVKIGTPTALQFRPLTILAIRPVNMPAFTTTLSAEDLSGSVSN